MYVFLKFMGAWAPRGPYVPPPLITFDNRTHGKHDLQISIIYNNDNDNNILLEFLIFNKADT